MYLPIEPYPLFSTNNRGGLLITSFPSTSPHNSSPHLLTHPRRVHPSHPSHRSHRNHRSRRRKASELWWHDLRCLRPWPLWLWRPCSCRRRFAVFLVLGTFLRGLFLREKRRVNGETWILLGAKREWRWERWWRGKEAHPILVKLLAILTVTPGHKL